jgi:hypothetical protein
VHYLGEGTNNGYAPQQTTRSSLVAFRHCVTPQPKLHVRVRVPSKHVVLHGDQDDWRR